MPNVINATSTGNGGLVSTGDDSGILNIQTNETTAITVDASQNTTFAKSIILSGSTSGTTTLASTAVAGTSTATFPAATGTVMVSGNMPAFRAYAASVTTTVLGNTDTKVSLDTEIFDTNSNFASSRFTPTVAGYYQINGGVQINYWNGIIFSAEIFKNGSVYALGGTSYPQTTGGVRATVSDIVYCNGSTDYIELYAYQYNASTSNVTATGTQSTYFSGCLVRAA